VGDAGAHAERDSLRRHDRRDIDGLDLVSSLRESRKPGEQLRLGDAPYSAEARLAQGPLEQRPVE